ncbi:multiple epidermal growth factor-like domains protein 8 [Phasianus colchicus]|uniref:multiple epidermal growth factor-like domains protein 8 n=1 Tax=Phasianus colchicus TaxID=9054 RepID=UPI00129EE6BE|nr:multiple epidermal growth factor-like domains protein 8 [Phasianus colchicus]
MAPPPHTKPRPILIAPPPDLAPPPAALLGHVAVYDAPSRSVFVYGGWRPLLGASGELHRLHCAPLRWEAVLQEPGCRAPPLALHAAVPSDGTLLVFGGRGAFGEDRSERPLLLGGRQRRWQPLRGGEWGRGPGGRGLMGSRVLWGRGSYGVRIPMG